MKTWIYDILKSIRLVRSAPQTTSEYLGLSDTYEEAMILINSRKHRSYSLDDDEQLIRSELSSWDKKRGKCLNCGHIFLKFLSNESDYCSVDCRSNDRYLHKVDQHIQSVQQAINHQEPSSSPNQPEISNKNSSSKQLAIASKKIIQESKSKLLPQESIGYYYAQSCVHFGEADFKPVSVNWAYSAVY